MKKLFISLIIISALFTNCSKDEPTTKTPIVTPLPTLPSNIVVGGFAFAPSVPSDLIQSLTTVYEENTSAGIATRTFHLVKFNSVGSIEGMESIQIAIVYPISQTKIDGTYSLLKSDITSTLSASVNYSKGSSGYFSEDGQIKVTDLGSNKFKLEFMDVLTVDYLTPISKRKITGDFEGTFKDDSTVF
jgi:hypothetical protein